MKSTLLLSAATLLTVAGTAIAQHADCCNNAVECDKARTSQSITFHIGNTPGSLAVFQTQPEAHSKIVMVQTDDDHEYKVVIEDGKTQAWVDGMKVARKNIKADDDTIRILDDDGHTLAEFEQPHAIELDEPIVPGMPLLPDHHQGHINRGHHDGPVFFYDDEDSEHDNNFDRPGIHITDHPPVMLGIQMGVVDDDTADELDIDKGEGIRVMKVLDGLPADKAGLKSGDIIIRVNGKPVDGLDSLNKALQDKEPGDKIKLRIVRGDDEKTVTVKLAKWDDKALGIDEDNMFFMPGTPDDGAIRELMKKIEKLQNHRGDASDEDFQHEIEKLLRNFKARNYELKLFTPGEDFDPEHPTPMFVEPNRNMDHRMQQRLEAMQERLDAMQERLENMQERLETILDLLENQEELDDD